MRSAECRPPLACRCLLALAAWLVPEPARSDWRSRWNSRLLNLLVLIDRGELAGTSVSQLAWLCRTALVDAFWTRVHQPSLRRWSLGPSFALTCAIAALLVLGVLTGGFSVTRWLLAGEFPGGPRRASPVFLYVFPIAIASISGVVLCICRPLALGRYPWRYWVFFGLKTSIILAIASLLWIEGGARLRVQIGSFPSRILFGGVLCCLVFIFAFCRSVIWCLADQRLRCPVCLQRLAMPVSLGSSSSVLDPSRTELLCRAGHGSLCVSDSDAGDADRWTALDGSWQELFEVAGSKR